MSDTPNTHIIKSARLLSWQVEAAKVFETLQKEESLVICSQRQVGKSFLCSQLLLYTAVNNPKSFSIYISPTNDSSRKFFNDLKRFVENSGFVNKVNESLLTIEFKNKSTIIFRSAESKLRGYSVKRNGILVCDESQYLPDSVWEVILPFTNVDKSIKVMISTPRFRRGMFYTFYQRALNKDKGYHLISTTDYDTSCFLSESQKEDYKKILTPSAYKSEILGQWLDDGEGLFGDYQSIYGDPIDKSPVYCGIDFSTTGTDYTFVSFFNKSHEMCGMWYDRDIKDPVERVNKIISILNTYPSLKHVVCETNSMGSVYISLLRKGLKHPNIIEEFTTTNTSKKEIIEDLIKCISQKDITLLNDPLLDYQFSIFTVTPLSKGNYTYQADPKATESHDDCVMATALAVHSFETNKGKYLVR